MSERQTVAVKDAEGNLRWFSVVDAEHWHGTTLDATVGSLDFSVFYANVRAWKELTPGISFFERTSPPFDPVKSAQTNETWPEPLNYVDGVLRYPCGWTNQDFDDARWTSQIVWTKASGWGRMSKPDSSEGCRSEDAVQAVKSASRSTPKVVSGISRSICF